MAARFMSPRVDSASGVFRISLNISNRETFYQFPAREVLSRYKVIDHVRRPFGILIRILGHCCPRSATCWRES